MNLITTLIVIIAIIYLWKKYWANDSEKNVLSLGKYYSERLENVKDSNILKGWDKNYKELIKRLGKTYEEYLHLLEKHRYSIIQQWNLRQDWRLYMQAHKDIQESDMDYGADLSEKYLMKAGERERRAKIRLDEIEKRFKALL
jgi:predicted hydrocarbon binding protein